LEKEFSGTTMGGKKIFAIYSHTSFYKNFVFISKLLKTRIFHAKFRARENAGNSNKKTSSGLKNHKTNKTQKICLISLQIIKKN
jgi:hypothetical protein